MTGTTNQVRVLPAAIPTMDTPGGASRQLVSAVVLGCVLIVVLGIVATAFAGVQLAVLPGFTWAYSSLYIVTGVVTAVMIMLSTPGIWSWSIALLAAAYVYSALMTVPFLLSFPGAFSIDPTPLLGGSQSSAWTFFLWHGGFLAFVLASTVVSMVMRRRRARERASGRLGSPPNRISVVLLGAGAAALVAVVVLAAGSALPDLLGVGLKSSKTMTFFALSWSVVALGLVTLGAVLAEARNRAQLRVWLVPVVLLATVAAVQSPMTERYAVGWYAPRLLGMVATSVLLVALLVQVWRQASALAGALAQSARLAEIVEQSPSGYALLDTERLIVDANQAFCDVTGLRRDQLIARSLDEVLSPDEPVLDLVAMMPVDTSVLTLRRRIARSDGSTLWVDLTAHRMFDAAGDPVGVSVSLVDASGDVAADLDPNAPVGTAVVDATGVITRATEAFGALVGRPRVELVGTSFLDVVFDSDRAAVLEAGQRMGLGGREVSGGELRLLRDGRVPFYAAVYGSALRNPRGQLVGAELQVIDIDARKRAETEALEARHFLEYRSTFDDLTGLLNRPTFVDRVQQLLDAGSTVAVVNLDIDSFQRVSNSMTRREGDAVLIEVVRRVRGLLADGTLVARVGGDEFAFAVPVADSAAADAAMNWAARVGEAIADEPFGTHAHELHLTCSVGVTVAQPGDVAADRIQEADLAAREAKAAGPGHRRLYGEPMRQALLARMEMVERIRAAIASREFTAWYQPVVSLTDGRLMGFEALSRWVRPNGSVVPPDEYLPVAEDTGLVVPVGAFTLEAAVTHLSNLPAPLVIGVNASPTELLTGDFAGSVMRTLKKHGVAPERLIVEITEQALFDVRQADDAGLKRLADEGVALFVDDFGTGYSSITHLRDFPIRGIKLDCSFTAQIDGPGDRATEIAATLAGLASRLGLESIAEGVETQKQADRLAEMGWQAAQGWLFGRPQPADADIASGIS